MRYTDGLGSLFRKGANMAAGKKCRDCKYCVIGAFATSNKGHCHAHPPVVLAEKFGVASEYPEVDAEGISCESFKEATA